MLVEFDCKESSTFADPLLPARGEQGGVVLPPLALDGCRRSFALHLGRKRLQYLTVLASSDGL